MAATLARVTLVWLSPGLPADRAELAAALPPDFVLAAPAGPTDDASEVSALPIGSLCVATVFESDLVSRLASRPDGVRLLVIGPEGQRPPAGSFGERAPDMVLAASSIAELATAIQQITPPVWTTPMAAVTSMDAVAGETSAPSARRGRLITAGAMIGALAIGGIVIASTEGSSSANANTGFGGRGGFGGGGGFPGGANFGGGFTGNGGGTQGGSAQGAIPGVTAANGQQLLACIRKQGFTGSVNQLLQSRNDPKLQQAFMTCVQQLGANGATTPSQTTGRP